MAGGRAASLDRPVSPLADINGLDREAFAGMFGHLFENSVWIVRKAADRRPFGTVDELLGACAAIIEDAGAAAQLDLIRVHPDLAGRMTVIQGLTPDSHREQGGAGLFHLTREEGMRFQTLNQAYRRKFGFPFVICVRSNDKRSILEAFGRRLGGGIEEERRVAVSEILEIARFRLSDMNLIWSAGTP